MSSSKAARLRRISSDARTFFSKASPPSETRVGWLIQVLSSGQALVDFDGNERGPLEARSATVVRADQGASLVEGTPLLLWFEDEASTRPVILGVLHDHLVAPADTIVAKLPESGSPNVLIDGKTLKLEGHDEVAIRCGKSSITLRKDGKVLIKGVSLVSHATSTNKIKGASVAIN